MLKHYAILYFATLIIMTAMDMLWLGAVARDFYRERIGDMIEFHFLPAILFYLMYVAGILVFASAGPSSSRMCLPSRLGPSTPNQLLYAALAKRLISPASQ